MLACLGEFLIKFNTDRISLSNGIQHFFKEQHIIMNTHFSPTVTIT
jgi:hypothetical protein